MIINFNLDFKLLTVFIALTALIKSISLRTQHQFIFRPPLYCVNHRDTPTFTYREAKTSLCGIRDTVGLACCLPNIMQQKIFVQDVNYHIILAKTLL